MLMLPFTSLVPLLLRADNNKASQAPVIMQKTTAEQECDDKRQSSSSSNTSSQNYRPAGDLLDLNLQPSFVRIFKPRCRSDPYVVTMGDLRPRNKDKVRRQLSHCSRIESQSLLEPRSQLVKCLVDESLDAYLANLSSWAKFDVFKFDCAISSYHGLSLMAEMATAIAYHHNLFVACNVSPQNFYACMREISNNYYRRNPYHTALHACDVLHAMHCLISEPSTSSILKPLEKLSLIFAAVCHDVAHPGVNQGFIIATNHVLHSFSFGETSSLLERHHFAVGWSILTTFGLLSDMDADSVTQLKANLCELILATDIARHASMVDAFKKLQSGGKFLPGQDPSHRSLLMCILMKCADISNPCRPWSLCKRWSSLICEEFFKQGDAERRMSKHISPGCDRHTYTVSGIQKNFIPHIAMPLFELFHSWSNSTLSRRLLDNLNGNFSRWVADNVKEQSEAKQRAAAASQKRRPSLLESEVPETAETSICGDSSSSDSDSEVGESSDAFDSKRNFFPLANNRRKSMPAAPIGVTDQSLLVHIYSGGSTFETSLSNHNKIPQRRKSLVATPSLMSAAIGNNGPIVKPNVVSMGLGFALSETKHSEVLQELQSRRHTLVSMMETVEQSAAESSHSSSSGESSAQQHAPSSSTDQTKPGDEINHLKDFRRSSEQPIRSRQKTMDNQKPNSIHRSTTAPSSVVPLTVYVTSIPNADTKKTPHHNRRHRRSCPSASNAWRGQRRGSEGTMLSSYVMDAEQSCACSMPTTPTQKSQSSNKNANRKARKSLPPPSALGWAFKSTPVVVDQECASAIVDVACRLKENWTRTGKRWSDGCLTVPQSFNKSPLINS